jgi:catalase-peroxidase
MRVLNTCVISNGFYKQNETLTNDFFVNLLDLRTTWKAVSESDDAFVGSDSWRIKIVGTRVDLIFGSNSELRALAEVYGYHDAHENL